VASEQDRYRLAVPPEEATKRLATARARGLELRARAEKVGEGLAEPYGIKAAVEPLDRWLRDKQIWIDQTINALQSVFAQARVADDFNFRRMSFKTNLGREKKLVLRDEREALQKALDELEQIEKQVAPGPSEPPPEREATVFVSHAAADKPLVTPFVDTILRLGSGVPTERLFYSSGADTGVPVGTPLNTYVRERVSDAGLVVAIVTPRFRERPYCLAELGAAWSRAGTLFPIALPGMGHRDLDGVLSGLIVKTLDDGSALDELHERLAKVVGRRTNVVTWGERRREWLDEVGEHVAKVYSPADSSN
jgi:hypothetical protein